MPSLLHLPGLAALALAAVLPLTSGPAISALPAAAAVTHIEAVNVSGAFARGVPLLEVDGFKIHASRREAPGMAEVHELDTDIVHVLEGSATIVTGGTVVDSRTTAPNEIRGASIRGGVTRQLASGDVLVVPNGTPHWFQSVQGPLLYYVVKVEARPATPAGARQ